MYTLRLADGTNPEHEPGTRLLTAHRRSNGDWLFSKGPRVAIDRRDPNNCGKLTVSTGANEFKLFTRGENPENIDANQLHLARTELLALAYERSHDKQAPDVLSCVMPACSVEGEREARPGNESSTGIRERCRTAQVLQDPSVHVLVSRVPTKGAEASIHGATLSLNFGGRATEASVKNFRMPLWEPKLLTGKLARTPLLTRPCPTPSQSSQTPASPRSVCSSLARPERMFSYWTLGSRSPRCKPSASR